MTKKYDLLLKGGRVLDPAQGLKGTLDVAFAGGKVAAVGLDIRAEEAQEVFDVAGKYVVPGLIDLHAHVYYRGGPTCDPDEICLPYGVTTVVDGGSTGPGNFPSLRHYVMERSLCRTLAFVHVATVGLPAIRMPELGHLGFADPEGAAKTVAENRDVVLGVKVRIDRRATDGNDLAALDLALKAARLCSAPLMVHIGNSDMTLPEILDRLRPGDIVTHCLTADRNGILDDAGKVLPQVWEAREKGIILDAAHGKSHFSFPVAQKALDQGFIPDTISSDLGSPGRLGPVFDFLTTMSKYLLLGVSLEEVVTRATAAPARIIGQAGKLGTIRAGAMGDAAVLGIEEGEFDYIDSFGGTVRGKERLRCYLTVKDGRVVHAAL